MTSQLLADLFAERVRQHPDRDFVVFGGRRWTYGEVADQANALAAALESLGLRRGEPLAIDLPNCPEWGLGHVQSVDGDRVTVNFEHGGKQLIKTSVVELIAVKD